MEITSTAALAVSAQRSQAQYELGVSALKQETQAQQQNANTLVQASSGGSTAAPFNPGLVTVDRGRNLNITV